MIQTALIQNAHADLVTDAAYDMYGLSLATCGLDQRIKIWTLDNDGQWTLEDDWKAHDAAITKLSWAHPTFGIVLASSSFDRSVKIWEQTHGEADGVMPHGHGGPKQDNGNSRWVERAVLLDSKGSVRAVDFAPHHFGLKLAAVSSDNQLRIYECLEQPALASWQLADEVDIPSLPSPGPAGSSTRTGTLAHTLAPGTPMPTSGSGAALDGASVNSLLQAAQQQQQAQQGGGAAAGRSGGIREADGGWCVSWCKERYWGEVLAVGCGTSGVIKILQLSAHRRPLVLLSLETPSSSALPSHRQSGSRTTSLPTAPSSLNLVGSSTASTSPNIKANDPIYAVTSVSWAPSCGRSFHLIATGSRDGHVRIWKVRPPPPHPSMTMSANGMNGSGHGYEDGEDAEMDTGTSESAEEKWSASLVAEFDEHTTGVGRVEWNITGTVLSSSGNDGKVRLWKQTVGGVWRTAGHISVEQEEEKTDGADVDMDE